MRIAMISEHASPLAALGGEDAGGQNTHVAELSAALAGLGHDVRVYTRRDDPRLPPTVEVRNGVTVVHVPAGPAAPVAKDRLLPHMGEFGRWLAAEWDAGAWTPEVAHAHFWMSGLATVSAARDIPTVLTYHALGSEKRRHQGVQDTSPPGRIGYERVLGRTVDRVVAQCQEEIRELQRLGVPTSSIVLVPSGVNGERFSPTGAVAPRDVDVPRVLAVGRLVERKGFADLIRALRWAPGAECVIVGGPPRDRLVDDPHAGALRAVAAETGVADRVRLVGAVPADEMPSWYRSADVVAAVPWYEPFGLTPLEAMSCGVPVVGAAVGGIVDTVVDGLTGDLVPARDPRALGLALRRLLGDPTRRYAYASAAVDRARHCYAWERAANQLETVYATVAAPTVPAVV